MPDETPADDERAVVLLVICNGCGAEFEWACGDEPETEWCPACRERQSDVPSSA